MNGNGGSSSFEQAFRNIDDVLRKEAGCTTELDYTEQSSWLLFLKYLDGLEQDRATKPSSTGRSIHTFEELDQEKLTPLLFLKYHSLADAVDELGRPDEIGKVFVGFQRFLYEEAA